MLKKSQFEQGQAMVIFVLGLAVLLGFAALAIDGSMVYSDRRFDQSAADTAALAGAGAIMNQFITQPNSQNFTCAGYTSLDNIGVLAAQQTAAANQFTITSQNLNGANHGVQVLCGTDPTGKYLDVWVKITSLTKTSFAQIFARNDIQSTSEAKVRARPPTIVPQEVLGYAIVSLNETANCGDGGGITRKGGGNDWIIVEKGGMYSYSCVQGKNKNVDIQEGGITAVQTIDSDFDAFDPHPGASPLPKPVFPTPDCNGYTGGYSTIAITDAQGRLVPGKYDSMIGVGNAILKSGLYCFRDSGVNHKCIQSEEGAGVTVVLVEGSYKGNGSGNCLKLSAWRKAVNGDWSDPSNPDRNKPAPIPGVAWYLPADNYNSIDFRGNGDTVIHGTLYAPSSDVSPGGNSVTLGVPSSQIIAYSINFGGTASLHITWTNNAEDTGTSSNATLDMLE